MKPKQVKQLIETAVENPLTTPPIMEWGAPGIGKSALPRQVAREKDIGFVDIRGPQLDPTDLRGIPAIVKVPCSCGSKKDCLLCGGVGYTEKAKWLAPTFLPTKGRGILFLDELPSAPPLVQASMYQLVLDRAIGEYTLPDGWYIIAAGNRIEDRAVSYRMPTALANRFTHIDPFETDLDNWVEWATRSGINPNIISFMRFKPELLWQFKPESSEKAFPSPRSWEFASRWVKSCPPRLLAAVLEGTIGKGATAEFVSFLKVQTELPDIDTILTGKSDFWPEKRMDLKYALIAALATHAKGVTQFERMLNYSEKLDEEFAVLLITMLAIKDEGAMASTASFPRWARCHADIIITSHKI